jgi:purine-binding chemotaxis protein CheW
MNGETTLSTIPRPGRKAQPVRKESSPVDWEAIRRSVLESSARLAWVDDLPQEALEQAWAQRAALLAQEIKTGDSGEQIQVVVVRLGREVYGLETDYVLDIRLLESLTRVPRVPTWIAGVVNLRGRIVSVLDLQRFLDLPSTENGSSPEASPRQLVVVGIPAMELAFLVDEVLAVESMPISQIQEASTSVRGIRAEYMRGIVNRNSSPASLQKAGGNQLGQGNPSPANQGRASLDSSPDSPLLLLLDLPALLSDKRLIVHEDIV